jgi:rubredoxin
MATYGRELLVHFHCASCAGWWSIGDPQQRLGPGPQTLLNRTWHCPWCGLAQVVTGNATQPPQAYSTAPRPEPPPHPGPTTALTEPRGRGPAE